MSKGRNTENFELLKSETDEEFLNGSLCEDFDFRFDVYSPSKFGEDRLVGNGNGKYDLINPNPGLHVQVFVSKDDGLSYEQVATWNVAGPAMAEFFADGSFSADFRGPHLIGDGFPDEDGNNGGTPDVAFIKYTRGNYNYVGDASNNAIEDLNGNGNMVDLAELFC